MANNIHLRSIFTRTGAIIAAVLVCMMGAFGVSAAQAHDELISSVPATGDVLTAAPKKLVLTFSGDVKEIGTILELTDTEGAAFETSFAISGREVTVTPAAALANGSYSLSARVVSSDGHPIDKKVAFEVKDPAAVSSSAAASKTPPAAAPAPSAEASETANAEATADEGTIAGLPAGLVWTVAGIAFLGIIAMVLLKVRRQTK